MTSHNVEPRRRGSVQGQLALSSTPSEAARLSEEAFRMDDDWGTLVWLVMTTGMHCGELGGLRFSRLHLDEVVIDLRRSWVAGRRTLT